jgi:hypothetical protein
LREKRASSCIQAGAIHVNQTASTFLNSKFSAVFKENDREAYLMEALENFEHEAKRMFGGKDQQISNIKVGGKNLNVPEINLQSGLLRVTSEQMASFFDPWVDHIIQSVQEQMTGHEAERIILVGGFGDSPYLRHRLQRAFPKLQLTVANDRSAEVVSDGATIWHIQRLVVARAARYTYGIAIQDQYNPSKFTHRGRPVEKRKGGSVVNGVWQVLVSKDAVLDDGSEIRRPLWTSYTSRQVNLSETSIDVFAYVVDGQKDPPDFVLDNDGNVVEGFYPICSIKADMSGMQSRMKSIWSLRGRSWRLHYEVVMLFGGPEFKACIAWQDASGKEKRGLAAVVPVKLSLGHLSGSSSEPVSPQAPSSLG